VSSRHWLLRVPEALSAAAGWQWCNAMDAAANTGSGSLEEFAQAYASVPRMPVVVLVPASFVLAVSVNVPQRQQRQMLAALPFLLEENVAADIEQLHVVAGVRIDAQRLQALAIERRLFAELLALLQSAGIDPEIVTLDALALPQAGMVFLDGDRSLLREADGGALVFDAQDAGVILNNVAGWPAGLRIACARDTDLAAARSIEADALAIEPAASVQFDEAPLPLLHLLAAQDGDAWARIPNLRQAEFTRRGAGEFSLGFDWRPLAWLAACLAVVGLGYQLALGMSYSRAADATREAQVALYKQVFPGSNNVPAPRKQMQGQIENGNVRGGVFVGLVARTAEGFASVGGGAAGYRPGNLAWDAAQRQLRIDVLARSLEDLDRLRAALEQRGLSVDIGAGIAQDGGYKARMNVAEGA
jgi:general secretion pathway protein L